MDKAQSVEDYIKQAPEAARAHLKEMREVLKKVAPDAEEGLKWGMPAFSLKRVLFTYAAFKSHVGLYPTPATIRKFEQELKSFKTGKGSIQFPLDKPLPKQLITKIAKFRVKDLQDNDAKWM